MRVVVFSDGSEDGLRVLGTVAALFDRAIAIEMTLAAVTWPERRSPIWDRAHEHRAMAWGDLHAAVALIVPQVFLEARSALGLHGERCEEVIANGDPATELLQILDDRGADLAIVAVTGGPKREDVLRWVSLLTAQSVCPVVVMHAPVLLSPTEA